MWKMWKPEILSSLLQAEFMQLVQELFWLKFSRLQILLTGYLTGTERATGKEKRELHTDLALDAIDFNQTGKNKIRVEPVLNKTENLVNCEFFNTNILSFNKPIDKEYYFNDSFVVYICIEGEFLICWDDNSEKVTKGETILLPAMIKEVTLKPVK